MDRCLLDASKGAKTKPFTRLDKDCTGRICRLGRLEFSHTSFLLQIIELHWQLQTRVASTTPWRPRIALMANPIGELICHVSFSTDDEVQNPHDPTVGRTHPSLQLQ